MRREIMTGLRYQANPPFVGMTQDQPGHQVGQRCLCLRWQPGPRRHAAGHCPRFSCEQVDLLRRAAARRHRLRLAWHGPLPDSGRERDVMRPKAGHSMMPQARSAHSARVPQALLVPPGRHGHRPPRAPGCRSTGRTSRLESQANGPHLSRSGYSEKQRHPICRSPRER
jgi:hypothetical protein